MTLELTYLVWAVVFLIFQTIVQSGFSNFSKGLGWALGQRDDDPEGSQIAGRLSRALRNYLETFPAFAALALIIAQTDASTTISTLGAAVYFWARIAYIPAYVSGILGVRSLVWFISVAGLVMMLFAVL